MTAKTKRKKLRRERRRAKQQTAEPATCKPQPPEQSTAGGGLQRRDLTVRTYHVRADSYNESDRSFEAVLATETPVLVFDMWRWEMLEEILRMDGAVIPAAGQVPLCDTHDRTTIQKQLGSCRNIRVEGNQLVGRNFISSAEQDAATKVKEGHVTDCSVGYRVLNSVDIEPGKTLEVNGEAYTAGARPLRITTEWELSENSLCPIGADVLAK
ncbi:MAG TPA: DUF2213 domain-containing protein, partial [Phycisphaerae bacterium]|nr:DUF2213 domain-containing protein [Phycisphaerae bacterium]